MIRSMLCSRSMLSLCSNSSSLRHCCIVPSGTCYWHRYFFLIDYAPHLSFLVVICSLTMVWIDWPNIKLSGGGGYLSCSLLVVVFVGVNL